MADIHDRFFDGLTNFLEVSSLVPHRGTDQGRDLIVARGGRVKVTANFAPSEPRVSVKLTVRREVPRGPTPLFDQLRAAREGESNLLEGKVEWCRDSTINQSESRVQVCRTLHDESEDWREHYEWIERQATILRRWAVSL